MTRQEVLQQQVDDGHEASLIRQYAGKRLLAREEQIIREALGWFRGAPDPNPHRAVQYIAALSEVRALLEDTEYREAKGATALAEIVTTSTEAD